MSRAWIQMCTKILSNIYKYTMMRQQYNGQKHPQSMEVKASKVATL